MPESTDAGATEAISEGQPTGTETPTPPAGETSSAPDNKTTFDADYVKGLRQEAAGHRTKLRDTETALTAAQERISALEAAATEISPRLTTAESNALRFEVALDKGLPLALAKRLTGATREEIEADAEGLKSLVGNRPPADLGQGAPRGNAAEPAKDISAALRALAGF